MDRDRIKTGVKTMFHLEAFKTRTGYQVTNGPIVIDFNQEFGIIESNTTNSAIIAYATGLAFKLERES